MTRSTSPRRNTGIGIAGGVAVVGAAFLAQPGPHGCGVIGDCIAVGLGSVMRQCDTNGRVGRSAAAVARERLPGRYEYVVISAGSNNPDDPNLEAQLRQIREQARGDRVVWIVPTHPRLGRAAALIRRVAAERADLLVPVSDPPRRGTAPDGVHPRAYQSLASAVVARLG